MTRLRDVTIQVRVVLGVVGWAVVVAGLAACFVVGLVPTFELVKTDGVAFTLAMVWLAGIGFASDLAGLIRQRDRRRRSEPTSRYTYTWDPQEGKWTIPKSS